MAMLKDYSGKGTRYESYHMTHIDSYDSYRTTSIIFDLRFSKEQLHTIGPSCKIICIAMNDIIKLMHVFGLLIRVGHVDLKCLKMNIKNWGNFEYFGAGKNGSKSKSDSEVFLISKILRDEKIFVVSILFWLNCHAPAFHPGTIYRSSTSWLNERFGGAVRGPGGAWISELGCSQNNIVLG